MRFEYVAGERMFVDFCGDTLAITDPQTGQLWQAQVFACALGASGYLYVEATRSQDLACWLGAHVKALEFYGRSPRVVVPDNLKSGVTKACWYDPELNRSYVELAEHFAMAVLPARPYHPRDTAAIEAAVQVTEHWILAPLRKRQFFSLAEGNAAIAEQLAMVNERPFRGQQISRRALVEQLECDALQPLPSTPYELATWKSAKVNLDYHVEFDARYHSVPYQLVHERGGARHGPGGRDFAPQPTGHQPCARVRTTSVHHQARTHASRAPSAPGVDAVKVGGLGRGAPASDHRSPS
jgi:hypothetical protein